MVSKFWQDLNSIASTVVPGYSAVESVVDNYVRDTTRPVPGSILFCSLYGAEHSGIYVGNGDIVELRGKLSRDSGCICRTGKSGFIQGTNALTVYVACFGNSSDPIGSDEVAQRASESVGKTRKYHLFQDNCHMFSSYCITGNLNNGDNLFTKLQNRIRREYGSFTWRAWH
ncbi:MAG: lecithin retinol acyltransferase family protein [Cyanobacteria bacterium J06592_8]